MSVSVVLVTHNDIGKALLKAATVTFGELPLTTVAVPVSYHTDPLALVAKLKPLIKKIGRSSGVLILTDMFGSTPSNIAQRLQQEDPTVESVVVAGLNLPMLIRVMNYPNLNLVALAQKAVSGGVEGIVNCLNRLGLRRHVKQDNYHH